MSRRVGGDKLLAWAVGSFVVAAVAFVVWLVVAAGPEKAGFWSVALALVWVPAVFLSLGCSCVWLATDRSGCVERRRDGLAS